MHEYCDDEFGDLCGAELAGDGTGSGEGARAGSRTARKSGERPAAVLAADGEGARCWFPPPPAVENLGELSE